MFNVVNCFYMVKLYKMLDLVIRNGRNVGLVIFVF